VLWLVDVRWASFDESGEPPPVGVETYKYLLRTVRAKEPLIVVAVVTERAPLDSGVHK